MEEMVITARPTATELSRAYGGTRVFVTGHTGFKGSWLSVWLQHVGAQVTGYALRPETQPSMFQELALESTTRTHFADVRSFDALAEAVNDAAPDFVFHLAAQALVRLSYAEPLQTIETNVLGTAHILEAVRRRAKPCVVVVVTSDKCYENREWPWGYRENDPMGGHDVYSMSKGAAELVVSSYRRSFFANHELIRVATARAGNVIGGGDWATDRIVPDFVRATTAGEPLVVRNPSAVRPWQHVLEPLGGYLLLGARLGEGKSLPLLCDAWNFGPHPENSCSVGNLIDEMVAHWGKGSWVSSAPTGVVHEAQQLRLSIDKASSQLGWQPRWDLATTCARTASWYRAHSARSGGMLDTTLAQIDDYMTSTLPAATGEAALERP